jgi:hypothetical protein
MKHIHMSTTQVLNVCLVAFVAIMVAAELPPSTYRFSNKKDIDEAMQLVCGQILLARQKAIAGGTRYRLHYDDQTGKWTTYREVSQGRWMAEGPDGSEMPRGIDVGLVGGSSDGYIEIDAKGGIENHGAPIVIRLADGSGVAKNIRISPAGLVQELPSW